ncbi:hypothetical protein J6590_003109 [Homalodisca vitripennis]|nr:hypothetical protein J6590_003109 [Homalodisca vitripennis]
MLQHYSMREVTTVGNPSTFGCTVFVQCKQRTTGTCVLFLGSFISKAVTANSCGQGTADPDHTHRSGCHCSYKPLSLKNRHPDDSQWYTRPAVKFCTECYCTLKRLCLIEDNAILSKSLQPDIDSTVLSEQQLGQRAL